MRTDSEINYAMLNGCFGLDRSRILSGEVMKTFSEGGNVQRHIRKKREYFYQINFDL